MGIRDVCGGEHGDVEAEGEVMGDASADLSMTGLTG